MNQLINGILVTFSVVFLALFIQPALAFAAAACPGVQAGSAQDQVLIGSGQAGNECKESGVKKTISAIVRILSFIVGIAAIIMILWAGLKYVTSGGESGKIATAKQTLIYAAVGLLVAALAQVIVNLALSASR